MLIIRDDWLMDKKKKREKDIGRITTRKEFPRKGLREHKTCATPNDPHHASHRYARRPHVYVLLHQSYNARVLVTAASQSAETLRT
jgi:hypothetical protein